MPELSRPGVEIIQELRTTSPTILTPTLVPCVVGVCNQIIEVLDDDGTVNSDAAVSGPAVAVASTAELYDLLGKNLQVRINNGVVQEFNFTKNDMTALSVAAAINAAIPAPSGFGAYVFDDGSDNFLQLRTTSEGKTSTIQIVGGTAVADFGWTDGYTYYGVGAYVQDAELILQSNFPDPRGNLDELEFDTDSFRIFFDLLTEVREILDSESFLRKGTSLTVVNDNDGDSTTPLVNLGENLLATPSRASVTGDTDVSTGKVLHGKTLAVKVNGSGKQVVTFVGDPVISSDSTAGLGWTFPKTTNISATVNGQALAITIAAAADLDGVITQINADSQTAFGIDIAFKSDANGNENVAGTYLGLVYGADPTSDDAASPFNAITVTADSEGEVFPSVPVYQLLATGGAGPRDAVEAQINAVIGAGIATISTNFVKLTAPIGVGGGPLGYESKIEILSEGTANAASPNGLGFVAPGYVGTAAFGAPCKVRVGDELYADGSLIGTVISVHPGAVSGLLRLDSEVALTATYSSWYILAKNLDTVPTAQWGVSVPTPDMYVNTQGNIVVKHDILRDTTGTPVSNAQVGMYLVYSALRKDVSPVAAQPALLTFDTVDDLESALWPLTPANPLGYGLYIAMVNSGAVKVTGIGVSEKTDDKPYGTVEAYQEVWDYLESKEVYAIAPMTNDLEVHTTLNTHVNAMSAPSKKGERIGIIYLGTPTRNVDTIVASGTDGDRGGSGPYTFDTKLVNLSQLLLAAGIDPTDIKIEDDVFVDIASDANHWNVTGAVDGGTKLSINVTFASDENTDNFYATGTFPSVISETFSVKIRGVAITDKEEEIATICARAEGFSNSRIWLMQLGSLKASVDGVESIIDGFYACAAKAGQVAGNAPQVPLTLYPMSGFTGVTDTNDRYNSTQLDTGAGSGVDWIIQEGIGAPVYSRHQLTTDVSSIEAREQSIKKVLDFGSKFLRGVLRIYVARYNISPNFIDGLALVLKGAVAWIVEKKVWQDANPNNIVQNEDQLDMLLADVSVEVPYPCNYIRLTLIV